MAPAGAVSCPSCAAECAPDARFCSSCGAGLALACPTCGAAASGRFCSQCGSALQPAAVAAAVPAQVIAPVAERRVTTVLFGDLVGFTPLSESRDAEDVRELLSRYFAVARTVIARYGGTVEKFIGDAVMAVWGVPVAHEDDAERAVRAGLDLVDAVSALGEEVGAAGLAMRVGLVTGEVAVTLGATAEGMVAGDPVNTAARVQTTAAPGEVWVDETTRTLTAAAVVYTDAGVHELKGKAEPVPLFVARQVVATVGGAQRVDGLEAPFVGRDREMRLVKELFHATLEERRPRLVAVSGMPGVGKSRLGWEFFKYIDGITDLVRWHRGRCLSYGETVPFWALAEIVRSRLDVLEGDEPVTVLDKLDAGLQRWVADADERAWLRPRLATLIGVAEAAGVTTTLARDDLFSSWQLFLESLVDGEATGVALLIEDVQWADDGLLDFLEQVLDRSQAPIFILTLGRPELGERRPTWASGRRSTPLYLEPLPDATMMTLVDGLVDGLTHEARRVLVDRSEGVPLYAVETVRALIDRDAVVPRGGRYVVADGDALTAEALAAPTSLQTLLAARLDALPPVERTAVQNAAVLGQSFTRGALAALTVGADDAAVDAVLDALVRKEILALETDPRSPERGQFRFVQAMVRSVAYETLAKRDRKTRHLLAAAHLAADPDADSFAAVLASHYLDARAAAPGDDDADELAVKAVDLLERAAQRAEAVGSPHQALRHYLRALEFAHDDAATARLAAAAGKAAVTAGDQTEGVQLAEQAIAAFDRLDMPLESARALVTVAEGLNGVGMGSQVPDRLEPVYASLEGVSGATPVLMRLAGQIARGYFGGRGDAAAGSPWIERAAALAEGEEDWEGLAYSLSGWAAMLMSMGRVTPGLSMLRIALEVARDHGVPSAELAVLNNLASFEVARDIGTARGHAEEGLALVRRLGDYDTGGYLLATASFVYWLSGEWDRLEPLAADARGDAFTNAVQTVYVSLARVMRGEPAPEPPTDADESERSVQLRAAVQSLRSLHAMTEGDSEAAADHATRAMEIFLEFGGLDDDFPTYWCQALDASLSVGRHDAAGTWLRTVSEAPRGTVSPLLRALIPYFRARLSDAEHADQALVSADFASAASALSAFGSPYWHGRCLLDHGEWAARQGRDGEARALIEEAARIFAELRATPWVARAERARALALR